MDIVWGLLMIAAKLFMAISGSKGKQTGVYRFLAARSRILWGDRVHQFYHVAGIIVALFGVAVTLGLVKRTAA